MPFLRGSRYALMTGGVVTEPLAVPLAYSQFTAANGTALDAYTPDYGPAWVEQYGDWNIQSNQANCVSLGASNFAVATVETALADCNFSTVLNITAGAGGLVFRFTNTSNLWIVYVSTNSFSLVRRQSGSPTVVTSGTGVKTGVLSLIEVTLSGSSITAVLDGVYTLTATSTFNATATKHGLYSEAAGTRHDDFQVFA